MSRLLQRPKIEMNVSLELTSEEVRALYALAGYGIDGFLEVFYKQMGKHYLQPHEAGLRSLFKTIRETLPPIIARHDAAMQAFALADPVVKSRREHNEMIARLMADKAESATSKR